VVPQTKNTTTDNNSMEPRSHVWCRDPDPEGDDAWILAEVLSKSAEDIHLVTLSKKVPVKLSRRRIIVDEQKTELKYDGVETANAPLSEADRAEGRDDDLIQLPHLHEPAILHAIHERFKHDRIYTYTGPVLIAVNPFQRLPLYTQPMLEAYRRDGLLRSQSLPPEHPLPPHVYSIADRSYRQMMRSSTDAAYSRELKSQSILISGESGAGKTETTKIVMMYLTTLGTSNDHGTTTSSGGISHDEGLSTMEKVLQSNPILEAFGNGKTLRNDNSSRFGKLIDLGFSRSGQLMGAKVQTYLLEKVRVGFHASGERNYHIFYQILRGATHDQLKRYHFHEGITGGLELANHMHYTGQGGAPQLREFTDEDGLGYTLKAMRSMGWHEEQIENVLRMVAGILHLGQVQFEAGESSGVEIAVIDDAMQTTVNHVAELLGVDVHKLQKALTERAVIARGDTIMSPISPAKALDARDAVAKTVYGALFLWVVEQVNSCIGWANDAEVRSTVGVLDIFGFECFAVNSFEQLCINFTNEALQQQFNKFIFKMEQDLYESEKINWAFISFPDNQDCLDLIQLRPNGLLPQLDDECKLGQRGSDRNWANRLYQTFVPSGNVSENGRFHATAIQKGKAMFCVNHFAGLVAYSAETGFLEKNKDEIPLTAKAMFESAPNKLMRDVFAVQLRASEDRSDSATAAGKPAKSKTVGTQFKEQLNSLMERVASTEPHYIRCLKPNDTAKAKLLTRKRVTEQLRYGGVLEAVRVARMGYPVRLDHVTFFKRYRMLLPQLKSNELPWTLDRQSADPQKMCIRLVEQILKDGRAEKDETSRAAKLRSMQTQPPPLDFPQADVQPGLTKIFMRKPPYDILEAHRVLHQSAATALLQSFFRGIKERRSYLLLQAAAEVAQRVYRGCVGRARWWSLKEAQASELLIKFLRTMVYKLRYICAKGGMVQLEALYRGRVVRRTLGAIRIQARWRMVKIQRAHLKLRSAAVAFQCTLRRRTARHLMLEMKREQKDIGKLKDNNEKLKSEMAGLKAMLNAMAKGEASSKESEARLQEKEQQIAVLENKIKVLERELETERLNVARLEKELEFVERASPSAFSLQHIAPVESPKTYHRRHHTSESVVARQHHTTEPTVPPQTPLRTIEPIVPPKTPLRIQDEGRENISLIANESSTPARVSGSAAIHAEAIAEYKDKISRLEKELETERKAHREKDVEIIKLRAKINGVKLSDVDLQAMMAPVDGKLQPPAPSEQQILENVAKEENLREEENNVLPIEQRRKDFTIQPEVAGNDVEEENEVAEAQAKQTSVSKPPMHNKNETSPRAATSKEVMSTLDKLGINLKETPKTSKENPFYGRSPSDYFPLVRRGMAALADELMTKEEEEVVTVGWKHDITSRKEREEALRDEVRRFDIKSKQFKHSLEEGIDVVLWQLNVNHGGTDGDNEDFVSKATPVTLKLAKRGELLVQTALLFGTRGGYLSKALGRGQKSAFDPLPLTEILEVKAGCCGYDQMSLPRSTKDQNKSANKSENKLSSLFLTFKATPNPVAALARTYFLRFKSRAARNDLMIGLRGLLADLQIKEGLSVSSLHTVTPQPSSTRRMPTANAVAHQSKGPVMPTIIDDDDEQTVTVPIQIVHREMNRERQAYDRLLLQMLQGNSDLKDKEDDLLLMRAKLDELTHNLDEKEKAQANDSKLIMALSKKLEILLMDNEDLRDQNDRLNDRLVAIESEKMNIMSNLQF